MKSPDGVFGEREQTASLKKDGPMEQFVSLSTGVRLQYLEQGRDDAVPVIFLHGVTDSWHSFEGVLRHLPASVRAFAISQRGHGESSRPDSGYLYSDLSADLAAFMDAVGLHTAVMVGHSMGASVAQRFVVDHQTRVTGMVLMAAFSTLHQDATIADFYQSAIAPLEDPIPLAFAREWQMSTIARAVPPAFLDTVVSETAKVPARVWRELFQGFLRTPDFTSELVGVSVPTLIVWGDRDTYATRSAQDRLLAVMPGARFVTYKGAGHGFHWEEPARFAKDLVTFLAESSAARRSERP
jgi:pimeloyl-ACP methyl ester carboxylesterase